VFCKNPNIYLCHSTYNSIDFFHNANAKNIVDKLKTISVLSTPYYKGVVALEKLEKVNESTLRSGDILYKDKHIGIVLKNKNGKIIIFQSAGSTEPYPVWKDKTKGVRDSTISGCDYNKNAKHGPIQSELNNSIIGTYFSTNAQAFRLVVPIVYVEGGNFDMGCTAEQGGDCFDWEKFSATTSKTPPYKNVPVDNFYIGRYEVTQKLWKDIMGSNPSAHKNCDDCPVESVSWDDIVGTSGKDIVIKGIKYYENGFIYKLNEKTDKKYRLPNEIEWEYAARGGNKTKGYKYSGSNDAAKVGWYNNLGGTTTREVGGKEPNELGIYDMSGNVHELCSSRFFPYDYTFDGGLTYELVTLYYDWLCGCYHNILITINTATYNPDFRIIRGGNYRQQETQTRVSFRNSFRKDNSANNIGFRLALDVEKKE